VAGLDGAAALRGARQSEPGRQHQGDLRSRQALRRRAPPGRRDGRGRLQRGRQGAGVEGRGRPQDRAAARHGGRGRGAGGGRGRGRGAVVRPAREPVSTALGALRAGAAGLLAAQGEEQLAAIVKGARVELAGPGETWSMGSREVSAHRVALVVPAPAFVALSGDAGRLAAVRAAFAYAMRSPETELAELHLELLLPVVE